MDFILTILIFYQTESIPPKTKSKTYSQISTAKQKSCYLSFTALVHEQLTFLNHLLNKKKKSWVQMIGYKLRDFFAEGKNKTEFIE